jgi:electron transfer flavoprotein alpha subunit
MAEILVLVEHEAGQPKKVTAELLTLAATLGEPSAVFLGGEGTYEKAKGFLAEYGAAKVYVGESADFDDFLVAPKAEALAQIAKTASPAAVLVAAAPE